MQGKVRSELTKPDSKRPKVSFSFTPSNGEALDAGSEPVPSRCGIYFKGAKVIPPVPVLHNSKHPAKVEVKPEVNEDGTDSSGVMPCSSGCHGVTSGEVDEAEVRCEDVKTEQQIAAGEADWTP